ncbi:hypothetical protein [Candidatus Poriferisodalis sp.]|uniref:hypothetical protein n=1 Tax=Candidatus Poriferisodalis sp. TaxID=3101277 RepID=UPI003B02942F
MACAGCAAGADSGGTLGDPNAAQGVGYGATAGAPLSDRPQVEVLPPASPRLPRLDPAAAPQTALGDLRSRYLPVWAPVLDWAFPPRTCGSAWELDGIAAPSGAGGIGIPPHGDAMQMTALGVMRYEFLVSRALAAPSPLAQICVAVGSVEPARTQALRRLAAAMAADGPRAARIAFPEEVTVVALGPGAALAVSCMPGGAAPGSVRDQTLRSLDAPADPLLRADAGPARLSAYLLLISVGQEDAVTDVSYRVSQVAAQEAADCAGLAGWAADWEDYVAARRAEGQVWAPRRAVVTVTELCVPAASTLPANGPECPLDWVR